MLLSWKASYYTTGRLELIFVGSIICFFRILPALFPQFIQVPATGSISEVEPLTRGIKVNCTIDLKRVVTKIGNETVSQVEWWELKQDSPPPIFSKRDKDKGNLEIISLNDLVPPLHLSFFASKG